MEFVIQKAILMKIDTHNQVETHLSVSLNKTISVNLKEVFGYMIFVLIHESIGSHSSN